MSESNALQRLIFDRLSSFPAVTAIVGTRITDAPPSTLPQPSITFGPSDIVPEDFTCFSGRVETIQIDCWSEAQDGKREVKALTDAVYKALHLYNAEPSSGALVQMRVGVMRVLDDPAGGFHGIVQVECEMEDAE
jgi:hypothetical protein